MEKEPLLSNENSPIWLGGQIQSIGIKELVHVGCVNLDPPWNIEVTSEPYCNADAADMFMLKACPGFIHMRQISKFVSEPHPKPLKELASIGFPIKVTVWIQKLLQMAKPLTLSYSIKTKAALGSS